MLGFFFISQQTGKKSLLLETVSSLFGCSFTRFSDLTVCSSCSVDCPMAPVLPARRLRLTAILCFRPKSEGLELGLGLGWVCEQDFIIPSDQYNTAISSEIVPLLGCGQSYVVSQARLTSLRGKGLVKWVCPTGMQLAE